MIGMADLEILDNLMLSTCEERGREEEGKGGKKRREREEEKKWRGREGGGGGRGIKEGERGKGRR